MTQDRAVTCKYIYYSHYIQARKFLDKLGDYYFFKSDSAPPIQETLCNVDI